MAKQLSDILEAAEQVRDEQTPEANTAERVGGVLTDLAQYVGQSLMVSDVQVEADASGVYLKLYFNDDNGEPYERKLKLPNAEPNAENPKSGVLSPALYEELKSAGGFKDLGEFDNKVDALAACATPEVAGNSKYCLLQFKVDGEYRYIKQSVDGYCCMQETLFEEEKHFRLIFFEDEAHKVVEIVEEWRKFGPAGVGYMYGTHSIYLQNEGGSVFGSRSAVIPIASSKDPGLMDPAQFTKLQGIAPVFKNNPTATASQNGLMSAADKQNLDALMTRVAALEAAASAAAE